jgi:hypothetical protein
LIGEAFQLGAVLHHGHVATNESLILHVDVDHARKLVVMEELLERRLDSERGVLRLHDHVEELGGDRGEQPVHNTVIDHDSLGIVMARRSIGVDVVAQAELADDGVEEALPLGVVRRAKVGVLFACVIQKNSRVRGSFL